MRLMEVINKVTAIVYYRGNIDDEDGTFSRQTTITKQLIEDLSEDNG